MQTGVKGKVHGDLRFLVYSMGRQSKTRPFKNTIKYFFFRFRLENLGKKIVECPAKDYCKAPPGYNNILKIAISAKVVLTANLWVQGGLYNGSIGTVTDIIGSPPTVIMVHFPDYIGPRFKMNKSVPIVQRRMSDNDSVNGGNWSFLQFELELAFAQTVFAFPFP